MVEKERSWSTLWELLVRRAEESPGRALYVRDRRGVQEFRTLSQIQASAARIGEGLRAHGVKPGKPVLVALPTGFDFVSTFFALQALAARPIPLGWPRDIDPLRGIANIARWRRIAGRYDARIMVCGGLGGRTKGGLQGIWPPYPLEKVIDVAGLLAEVPSRVEIDPVRGQGGDVAYIQSTSGTTGAPRGVKLTHRGIQTSVEAIGKRIEVEDEDVLVSWLPLDNIMGLMGAVIFSLHWGLRCVLLHPDHFLKHPEDWLWAIHDHRATLSLAPNFGYNYCVRRANASKLRGLDLSSWRIAMNGSEPVRAQHMQAFARRFHEFGLRDHVLMPVYGLSEATLGVTFHKAGAPIRVDGINRQELENQGRATRLPPEGASRPYERMHLVSLGKALEGVEVRIVDEEGEALGERCLGEVAIRGPNVMEGYVQKTCGDHGNAARKLDGWLLTGDLGYFADDEFFYLCRRADLIEMENGRRVFPEEVELFVDAVDGIRAGSTAVFQASMVVGASEDALVVAFERQAGADPDEVAESIRTRLSRHLNIEAPTLVDLSAGSIPKTTTGKVRRARCRGYYEAGLLGQGGLSVLHPARLRRVLADLGEAIVGGKEALAARFSDQDR